MKKLLDETTDDLTRALLEAGRSHRPPAGNQAKVLMAIGAGAGVGLFSSKAFAWLGTSAGKLTLLGVGLGIAGSVWMVLPSAEPDRSEARLSPVSSAAAAVPSAAAVSSAAGVPSAPTPSSVSVPVAAAPSDPSGSSLTSSVSSADPTRHAYAPAASEWRRRAAGERKRAATRRDVAAQRVETNPEGPLSAASAAPPTVGASAQRVGSPGAVSPGNASNGSAPNGAASPAVAGLDAVEARGFGLETEIQLVDAMRGAAQRNDTSALRHLVDSYRGTFPEGQLRQEVSELALRTLSPAR